jgi:hypothetical protein
MEQERKKYSILDELAKCSGYDIALMTTFNFEIGFFERAVLNRLYAKDVKTISLFVDSKELNRALYEFDVSNSGSHIGRRYMVNPVKIDGSFHPKVILLLGEKKARLFVGSANIKTSGYATNNEVFNFIDYDVNQPEYLDVIVEAIDFFDAINEISYKLDNAVLKAAKKKIYYHKSERNGEIFLLHNMEIPVLDQVETIIPEKVESISIAVPYFDKELQALQQIKHRYPWANIELYIQNKNSTFPVEYNENNCLVENINVFSKFLDNTSSASGNFYHGKVFLFKTKDKSYILYGSSNCTLSALTKTYSNGGNVECDFLEIGEVSDFDYFFDNMDFKNKEKLVCQKMTFEDSFTSFFTFKYGEVVKERIELHIGCQKDVSNLVIKLVDNELKYEALKGELIVYIGEEFRDLITDIFEISITFGNQTDTIRCWTYNSVVLANNRESLNRRDNLSDFEIDSNGDKYIEDRIKFLRAEATCFNELQEYRNNLKYINQIKMEQETESDEREDFIINYEIPDEYRFAYRQYSAASKIRNLFVRRFMSSSFVIEVEEKERKEKPVKTHIIEASNSVCRRATSEEIRFERFIKDKIKGMMNDAYVEVIDLEHYIGLVQVVIEIFEKYCDNENVEDIFLPDYVFQTKSLFMRKIIEKPIDNLPNKEEMKTAIIQKSLQTILETYIFYYNIHDSDERWQFESLNKALLSSLEKNYKLRQTYKPFIKQIIKDGKDGIATLGFERACSYIEKLYGYKTYEMLCDMISNKYPESKINLDGTSIRISVNVEGLNGCGIPDSGLLREISLFSRNVTKINMVYIDFDNIQANTEKKNIIVKISHSINLDYHQWKYVEIRFDGTRYCPKSQNIMF